MQQRDKISSTGPHGPSWCCSSDQSETVYISETWFHTLDPNDYVDQAFWERGCYVWSSSLQRSEIMVITSPTFRWFMLKGDGVVVPNTNDAADADPSAAIAVYIRLRSCQTNQIGKRVIRMLSCSEHRVIYPIFGALFRAW